MEESFDRRNAEEEKKMDNRHHSSGGSGRHHHSRRKRKWKVKRFWEKHKKIIACCCIVLLVVAMLVAVSFLEKSIKPPKAGYGTNQETTADDVDNNEEILGVEIPLFRDEVVLIRQGARLMATRDVSVPLSGVIHRYRNSGERSDVGLPVELSLRITGVPRGCSIVSVKIEVSEDSTFLNPRIALVEEETSARFYHLKTNTTYCYRISVLLSDKSVTAVQGSFKTADTPRLMSIDGAVNVRDIGGWKAENGRRIRQGLLYRGSEIDGAVEASFKLTQKGKEDMLGVLGIRTDMDLRSATISTGNSDGLGANVEHYYYGVTGYSGIFKDYEGIRAVFSDLADPKKYPVYLHCTYGLDRTGTICYLLEALLGVSEEDLLRDYELSALYYGITSEAEMEKFVSDIKALDGETMQKKVEGYLLSIGVTEEEIVSIKNIFLE